MDRFGEKLSEGFVAEVLADVLRDASAAFAMLAPDGDRYTLYVKARSPLSDRLAMRLDDRLRANPHYALCRDLGQLQSAAIFQIEEPRPRDLH